MALHDYLKTVKDEELIGMLVTRLLVPEHGEIALTILAERTGMQPEQVVQRLLLEGQPAALVGNHVVSQVVNPVESSGTVDVRNLFQSMTETELAVYGERPQPVRILAEYGREQERRLYGEKPDYTAMTIAAMRRK